MKKLVFLLLICCYQLSAEKIIDCVGFHHCEITEPIKYQESDDLKFRSTAPKFSGKSIDTEKEPEFKLILKVPVSVNDLDIAQISIESNADDQTIPASLFTAFPNVRHVYAGPDLACFGP
jgi:hypothetical protein